MTTTGEKRRGISIFRAKDSVDLGDSDFMAMPQMSAETGAAFGESLASGLGEGGTVKVLVRQGPDEGGFSLVHLWFKANYPLVRHTHDVDCLYYVLSGAAVMGSQTLRPGDSFFVPANAPYRYNAGPDGVEILEIRHGVERFDMKIPDASPEQWSAMKETSAANRDRWKAESLSPTFAANSG